MNDHDLNLLRLDSVLARRGKARSQHFKDIKEGVFPPGIRRSFKISSWLDREVTAVNAAEAAGATPEQLRALVCHLIEERARLMPAECLAMPMPDSGEMAAQVA